MIPELIVLVTSLWALSTGIPTDKTDLADTVRLLQEQMSALLDHRQQDYNALEESLRQSIEKNTELSVLKNEINQLRKDMSSQTEAKNERLRLRWLATTVAELQTSLGELMRTRNVDEEMAEREKLRTEIELLRSDVAGLDRGVRELTSRVFKVEAGLGVFKLDLAALRDTTRQLGQSYSKVNNQLNEVQSEVKHHQPVSDSNEVSSSPLHSTRHALSRLPSTLHHLNERLDKLERKLTLVSRRRATLMEKRIVYEDRENMSRRVRVLEGIGRDLTEKIRNQTAAQEELRKLLTSEESLNSSVSRAANVTRELEHVEDEYRKLVDSLPGNCNQKDGLTLLAPGPGAPLLAACRKGWIVVGRRVDGTVNFDRTWNDYAQGFGSPINEFWAGNEALYRLSKDNCTRLRVELNDIDGNYWMANYENFSVGSEETGYRLRVSGYSGNATDAMSYQNNMAFSAKDRDMDISSTDCAANYHGGWWFSHCQHANLNGRYSLGLTWYRSDTNQWMAVASAELSVQRKQQCL